MDRARVLDSIGQAEIRSAPTAHFVIDDFLAPDDHAAIERSILPVDAMTRYEPPHQFRYYYMLDRRGVENLNQDFRTAWTSVADLFLDADVISALHAKFRPTIREQTKHRARLLEKCTEHGQIVETPRLMFTTDSQDFVLKPHTDSGPKVVTLLYYLAEPGQPEDWGTEFYVPMKEGFSSFASEHFDPEDFRATAQAPFKPNTAVCFVKTDTSFHGVTAHGLAGKRRNMIVLNLELGKRPDFDFAINVDRAHFYE
jgi:hypothetical protein